MENTNDIHFSHQSHRRSMYEMCNLETIWIPFPFGFCFLPSPPVDDIYCTSLIRRHATTFFAARFCVATTYSRVATIRGPRLFEGHDYSRATTIRGPRLFKGGVYSKKYSKIHIWSTVWQEIITNQNDLHKYAVDC